MERKKEVAFVECGHIAACLECAEKLTTCPICRANVESILKIFLV